MSSLVVIISVRFKTNAGILPVHKILAGHMIPVFRAVDRSPGAPLIEKMPYALVISKSVRITGQTRNGLYMV
jgi:hypothetical protein